VNPVVRFLVGAFVNAAIYYAVNRLFWPGDRSEMATIPPAVISGLVAQALSFRRERIKSNGKDPYAPRYYFVAGLITLAVCVAFWVRVSPSLGNYRMVAMISGLIFSLYLFGYGAMLQQNTSAEGVSSGG
jgi:hypothetical protein